LRMFLNRAFERLETLPSDKELEEIKGIRGWLIRLAAKELRRVEGSMVAFFIKQRDIRLMNKAIVYVKENENCREILFLHVCNEEQHKKEEESDCDSYFSSDVATLQKVYPKMKLRFQEVVTIEEFDGPLLRKLSQQYGIRNDKMFISCPSKKFPHDIAELGGVRLITS
jgi:hypothetical protein